MSSFVQSNKPELESFAIIENEHYFWLASWYAKILGYKSLSTFKNVIKKAKDSAVELGVEIESNFIKYSRKNNGRNIQDYKLTKFACFLVAMHADTRKPVVKKAQVYFLNELEELNLVMKGQNFFERKKARDEIKETSKILNIAARRASVKDFRYFINEGYLGLYNMTINQLKEARGIRMDDDLFDSMGTTELVANIFRIVMTKERLARLINPNEERAAREHWRISSDIRSMIRENTGMTPEELPSKMSLKTLQKKLKMAQKKLNALIPEKNKVESSEEEYLVVH